MPTRKETEDRIEKELLLALAVERSISFLYKQNFNSLVNKYSSLMKPYWRNGNFDINMYNRDKTYNKIFREKLKELDLEITAFATNVNIGMESKLYPLLQQEYIRVSSIVYQDAGMAIPLRLSSKEIVKEAVQRSFSRDNLQFSQRIWGSTSRMESQLRQMLNESIASGRSIDETAKLFAKATGQSFNNCRRIIRTETIATYTKASLDSYKEIGIQEVRIIREADACPICTSKRNILPLSEAFVPETAPPHHPNCKCAIAPIIK